MAHTRIRLHRNGFGAALAAALTAAFVMLLPQSAQAAERPPIRYSTGLDDAPIYEIRSSDSGRCMDIAGESKEPGTRIQAFDCKGGLHQRFTFHQLNMVSWSFNIGTWGGAQCLKEQSSPFGPTTLVQGPRDNDCAVFNWVERDSASATRWELVSTRGLCVQDSGRREALTLASCTYGSTNGPTFWMPRYAGTHDFPAGT
ncbi:ricin-type beta-trefoil lectin domain protein [Streptomyces sp. NPDC089799]|uniref:RICIN domain-containing protein n=1 Tax=Streptomyces sp. NPDC089799 TaxID=3155066 RepID=UPI00341F6DB6